MKKEIKISEEDFKILQRVKETNLEDKQRNRLDTIKANKRRVVQFGRMIKDKKEQIKDKIYKEKSETYIDGAKPDFILQNEIEDIQAHIEQLKEVTKKTQEEYDKMPHKPKKPRK